MLPTVLSIRTVRPRSTARAAALVTRRSLRVASVAGRSARRLAASADFEGAGTRGLRRQNVR